jgi:OmpA-OmpF porin, OOP family
MGFMQKVIFMGMMGCLLSCSDTGNAQTIYRYKKDPAIGIHFSLYDFNSAFILSKMGVSQLLKAGNLTNIGDMQPGLALSFLEGLTDHLDYMVRYTGSFVDYPFPNSPGYEDEYLLSALDVSLHLKLLSDKYWVTPFVSGGVGSFYYKANFGAYMPLGLGLQVNFFNEAYLLVNLQYQVGVSENAASAFYYSLGVVGSIGTPKKK